VIHAGLYPSHYAAPDSDSQRRYATTDRLKFDGTLLVGASRVFHYNDFAYATGDDEHSRPSVIGKPRSARPWALGGKETAIPLAGIGNLLGFAVRVKLNYGHYYRKT
jgi:hypothetical protein